MTDQIIFCQHAKDYDVAKYYRDKYFFTPNNMDDPYTWTFNHNDHMHILFIVNDETIGYAHIQLWHDKRAAIRIIAIDESIRRKGYGSEFMKFIEAWLKEHDYKSIHAESSPSALAFYKKRHYVEMAFNDPDGYESGPEDIAVGKTLLS